MRKPKIIIFDLEVLASQTYKGDLRAAPGYILMMAWKELNKKDVHVMTVLDHPGKNILDDGPIVTEIRKVLEDADMLIYHFGDRFDFPFIRTRLARWGLPNLDKPLTFDTCSVARKNLSIKSNSLKSLAYFFGLKESKMEIPHDTWLLANAGDKDAILQLAERCKSDVRLTEQVYKKELPLVADHPDVWKSAALRSLEHNWTRPKRCTSCGNKRFKEAGYSQSKKEVKKRWKCLHKPCQQSIYVTVPQALHKDL